MATSPSGSTGGTSSTGNPSGTPLRGLPRHYATFTEKHPEVAQALEQLGLSLKAAGPLDAKTIELLRLATAVGARAEGAVHSHARRAREAGATPQEIRHAVLLAITTIGFPGAMAAMTWVNDVLEGSE